jgi:hypothetical protein
MINQCDAGHQTKKEVRLLPTSKGDLHGNVIVCYEHYLKEIKYRKEMGSDLLPAWEELKVYEAA